MTTPIVISALENITLCHFLNQERQDQITRGTIVIQERRIGAIFIVLSALENILQRHFRAHQLRH